jgi:NAD(P)-dependent dehydrogenase (short-subunit alcohol dehydrogenase family)
MKFSLQNKVVVITGAGAGIGRVTAQTIVRQGAKVVVTDIHPENLSETSQLITQEGGEVLALEQDVAEEAGWTTLFQAAGRHFGGIDALVNNAGVYTIAPIAETSLDEWNRLMSINVTGVFLGAKHAVPYLENRQGGAIINISSIAGLQGAYGHTLYSASKGAVRLMTKSLAAELGAKNVRVNSVHPTYVNTAMFQYASGIFGLSESELGPKMSPLGRLATAEDVANMIAFLLSDEAQYLSGAEFVVDGAGTACKML